MKLKNANPSEVNSKFLKTCDVPLYDFKIEPFTMVIFGGAGDLSQRKLLPALYHLYHEEKLIKEFSILGFGLPEFSDAEYRRLSKEAIKRFGPAQSDEKRLNDFTKNLFYLPADLKDGKAYKNLYAQIDKLSQRRGAAKSNIIFYLAVPPTMLPVIVERLNQANLCKDTNNRIIVEKPFGKDRSSAIKLNRSILKAFDENQIYRIDHYLGKDTVQNIIFFRFGNSIFEPLWNRRYIDHVQITVAEDIGIEHRGVFYEQAGVVRDIVQNHIMQLIALVAMEPPVGFEADLIRDEKVKVFRTIRQMDRDYIDTFTVRGQYGPGKINGGKVCGYRKEKNVSPISNTPTFFAGKFYIDNWRWAGVPFYVRSGKRLPQRVSEIYVEFKQPPLRLFGRTCDVLAPNSLILSIQPQEEICLGLSVKYPGIGNQPHAVHMEFNYEKSFNIKQHPAYERLLVDCIKGDLTLFARQDGVEAMWSIVDQIIRRWEQSPAKDFPNYAAGTWGPEEAHELLKRDGKKWRFADGRQ